MPTTTVSSLQIREHLARINKTAADAEAASSPLRFASAVDRNRRTDRGHVADITWARGLLATESVKYGDHTEAVTRLSDQGREFLGLAPLVTVEFAGDTGTFEVPIERDDRAPFVVGVLLIGGWQYSSHATADEVAGIVAEAEGRGMQARSGVVCAAGAERLGLAA